MTPEGKVKAATKKLFAAYPVWYYMPIPSAYGNTSGLPDFCCIVKLPPSWNVQAYPFFIETKSPGKKPTALQLKKKAEIERIGATWFLVDGEESLKIVENWLKEITT